MSSQLPSRPASGRSHKKTMPLSNCAFVFVGSLILMDFPAQAAEPQCAVHRIADQKADEDTIRRIEAGWLKAEYRGDVDFLNCLLMPGYRVIGAKDQTVRTKESILAWVATNKGKTTDVPPLETTVVVNGDVAIAYSLMKGHKKTGEPYEASFVDSYVLEGGAWRAFAGVDQ